VSSKRLKLASGSPRRAELLTQIGIPFEVAVPDVDESPLPGETALVYVERMARAKAVAVPAAGCVVLAADTVVVLGGSILGKPADEADGVRMLCALGGRTHEVLTAIAVTDGSNLHAEVVQTVVRFVEVDEALARAYWSTGEGADKAGGYGIQGIGGILAESITGSYSAVVGLPLSETERALARFGVDTWRYR
jgi:septum formation protein